MQIALSGLGKAGLQVLRAVYETPDMDLALAFCRNGSDKAGQKISDVTLARTIHAPIYEIQNAEQAFHDIPIDALIDFSDKDATLEIAPVCAKYGISLVICTTGYTPEEMERLKEIAKLPKASMVYAPNVTIGINVLMRLASELAQILPNYDFLITERHHNKKKDEVSATAEAIGSLLEKSLHKKPPITAVRAGGYVGYHEVTAAGEHERITIIHESFSRLAFANGAVLAAQYLLGKTGFHTMQELIDEHFAASN